MTDINHPSDAREGGDWGRHVGLVRSSLKAVNVLLLEGRATLVADFDPQQWEARYASLPLPNLLLRDAEGELAGFLGVSLDARQGRLVVVASVLGRSEVLLAEPVAEGLIGVLREGVQWWLAHQPGEAVSDVRPVSEVQPGVQAAAAQYERLSFWGKYRSMIQSALETVNHELLEGKAKVTVDLTPHALELRHGALELPNLALRTFDNSLLGFLGVFPSKDGNRLAITVSVVQHSKMLHIEPTAEAVREALHEAAQWWLQNQMPVGKKALLGWGGKYSEVQTGSERGNPLWTIWRYPRETIRQIVTVDPSYGVIPLTIVSGLINGFVPDYQPEYYFSSLPLEIVRSVIWSLVLLYVLGYLISNIGQRSFSGKASQADVRAAIAWGGVPSMALSLGSIGLFLTGLALFGSSDAFFQGWCVIMVPLYVGVFVVYYLPCIAEVHQISLGDAFWASCSAWVALWLVRVALGFLLQL